MAEQAITKNDNRAVMQPEGDVVAGTVPGLRSTMRGVLAEGVRELVVDLSRVEMMDSSGIGLLIAAHNSLVKLGGRLEVIHASQDILELFRAMRIPQHFQVSGE